MRSYTFHSFYCISCGKKSFELPRSNGKLKKRFHRKKLYCPHCGFSVNHVECRDDFDAWEFEEKWKSGDYILEAMESKEYCEQGDRMKCLKLSI